MLTFMTADTLSKTNIKNGTLVFNLTSFKMGFHKINLAPPYECMVLEPKVFDMYYAEYLLKNDVVFGELMKVVSPIFEGCNIILLVTIGEGWDIITESLQKFLQQRYNIISTICHEPDDYDEFSNQLSMNQSVLHNFNVDRMRFLNLFISSNGAEAVEESIITEDDFLE